MCLLELGGDLGTEGYYTRTMSLSGNFDTLIFRMRLCLTREMDENWEFSLFVHIIVSHPSSYNCEVTRRSRNILKTTHEQKSSAVCVYVAPLSSPVLYRIYKMPTKPTPKVALAL